MRECVKVLFTGHLPFTSRKNTFNPFSVISLRVLFFLFISITAALNLQAQKLVRDTVVVLPGVGQTVTFERNFDGKPQPVTKDSLVVFLYEDTISQPWYFIRDIIVTSSNLFPDCIYINPLENLPGRSSPQFFLKKLEDSNLERALFWHNPKSVCVINSLEQRYRVPASSRYYLDNRHIQINRKNEVWSDTLTRKIASHYVQPFYFRKTEVTNAEYREFVCWVRDSIAHTRLKHFNADGTLNWTTKIDYADSLIRDKIGFFLPQQMRFEKSAEADTRKLVYKFRNSPPELGCDSVAIYPDTLGWIHDFSYSYNDPLTNMYFWHPVNNDYPVSGVSYWQCLAYLDWLTVKLNKQCASKGFTVSCQLPNAAEWDMVSTAQTSNDKPVLFGNNYNYFCDDTWITDLTTHTRYTGKKVVYIRPEEHRDTFSLDKIYVRSQIPFPMYPTDALRKGLNQHVSFPGNLVVDNGFHTQPVNAETFDYHYTLTRSSREMRELRSNPYFRIHLDSNGVSHLDGNVSEWLRNDINESWRPLMEKRLNYWPSLMTAEDSIVRSIEKYYYQQLPANGKLVMGGNWYDERYSFVHGKNPAGYNAKTFLEPGEQHCTVGFRYVIYVTAIENTPSSKQKH